MAEKPPSFLDRLSSDEYDPLPYTPSDRRVLAHTDQLVQGSAERIKVRPHLLHGRAATAAGLIALNQEWGVDFYRVPPDAVADDATAAEAFRGRGIVIDAQTHFMAPHCARTVSRDIVVDMYKAIMPDWWTETNDLVAFTVAEYISNVFLETETAVAILTSGPGLDDTRPLFNEEMLATRELVDRFAGTGRLLNHTVVHADVPEEIEAMAEWRERCNPVGWKVYTPGRLGADGFEHGWMLDDERFGLPFLERARNLGVPLVCAHKGISLMVDNGSPRDIGPAARAFRDMRFVVYHSGYELPLHGAPAEGAFTDETAGLGVNRLIQSAREAGIGKGGNIYPELGTTWFSLIRRPVEAAHVLGKLIAYFGEDNVIWGTDSCWYGAAQPIVDAFRVFQIPDWMCETYGYSPLTPEMKEKILSLNAARVYGIDLAAARRAAETDDLAWARALLQQYKADGFPALR
ncbi:amidohydrolase family protein [Inquilinus sp. OTU3971]|uniref:amidohydrolase family protein n=1 Tax=Inquilinus sp. OTU3971 TaxID=3043855 RepID=UPI00313BA92F